MNIVANHIFANEMLAEKLIIYWIDNGQGERQLVDLIHPDKVAVDSWFELRFNTLTVWQCSS